MTVFQNSIIVDDDYIAEHGNAITGNFQGSFMQPAILITTKKHVLLHDCLLQGTDDIVYASGSGDLTIMDCCFSGLNPNVVGTRKGRGIRMENMVNLAVLGCIFTAVGYPIYVNRYVGNFSKDQTIRITNNLFYNVDGRPSDGKNGYLKTGNGRTHAILLNAIQNVPFIEIAWNQIINQPFVSDVSDNINFYNSSGTPTSHILCHDNYIQGAYSITPGSAEKYTGGGIITDGQPTNAAKATSFVDIYDNQIVSTSNYGVSIASGHDNKAYDNRVVSCGFLSDGTPHAMTYGNGFNNYNNYSQSSTIFFGNTVHDNLSGYIRPDSSKQPMRSDWYLPGQAGTITNTRFLPSTSASPTIEDELNEFVLWQQKYLERV